VPDWAAKILLVGRQTITVKYVSVANGLGVEACYPRVSMLLVRVHAYKNLKNQNSIAKP
jgi:hypothetical protein